MPAVYSLSSPRDTNAPPRGPAKADGLPLPPAHDRPRDAEFEQVARREKQQQRSAVAPARRTHRVKTGETFSGIAAASHLPKRTLYRANPQFDPRREDGLLAYDRGTDGGWDPDYLRPGDRIRVPAERPRPPAQIVAPRPAPSAMPAPGTPTPPVVAATAAPSPQAPGGTIGVPFARLIPVRAGAGLEYGWKAASSDPWTRSPYAKASWAIYDRPGRELNLNVKYKSTPTTAPDGAPQRARTLDVGLVFGRKLEIGASVELRRGADRTSWYASDKQQDLLVDTLKLKVGKIRPMEIGHAVCRGIADSVAQYRADPNTANKWAPLRDAVWTAVKGTELQVSAEQALHPTAQTGVLGNLAPKGTLGDLQSGLRPPQNPTPGATLAGWVVGTAASYAGGKATDLVIGKDLRHPIARKAVDGLGAGLVGVAASTATQKAWPALAPRAASLAGKLAPADSKIAVAVRQGAQVARQVATQITTRVAGKVAPIVSKVAPVVGKATRIAGSLPLVGGAGKVLSKMVRVGGPAGAVVAGIPDAVDAYKAFRAGDKAAGWRSVAKAGVRIGCTAAGAAALSFIPVVGTVVGAVAGGIAGDMLAKLF